jgi:hypothetical protein
MVKQKKKRTKIYQGAASQRPVITRISAANRNSIQQWWFEKKRVAKPALIAIGVATLLIGLVSELVHIFF